MKKTRKQTALAKCVLATIMAMGMMGYTTVWAEDTVTPSPIDKSVSKDSAGHIYDASHNYNKGYFWTDLGHAQVQVPASRLNCSRRLFIILRMINGKRVALAGVLYMRAITPKWSVRSL